MLQHLPSDINGDRLHSKESRGRRSILYYSASSSEFTSQDYYEDPSMSGTKRLVQYEVMISGYQILISG